MKVLLIAHLFPPKHIAGAEQYILNLAHFLISKGHEVRVLLRQANYKAINEDYNFEGIDVFISHKKYEGLVGPVEIQLDWCTHMIAHLENMPWTVDMGRMFKKPVFFISHNSWDYPCINQRTMESKYPVGVIYNSHWMKEKLNYPQRSIVLHPMTDKSKVIEGNEPWTAPRITIINSNERKGGEIFRRLIWAMPNRLFMIVLGAYDTQIVPCQENVMVVGPSTDMKEFYKDTRILLVPSAYESWSMACSEAMANGIPVICSATPGLKENAGDVGIYVDSPRMRTWMKKHEPPTNMEDAESINRWMKEEQTPAMEVLNDDDINMWIEEIKRLDDLEYYFSMSEKVRARAAGQDPILELEAVEKFILNEN